MSDQFLDEQDEQTMAQLRELHARVDPVPAGLVERIEFALTVQALHAEVAELMDDELLATRAGPVQPGEVTRTESVTFQAASLSLMVSLGPGSDDDVVRVDGWVTRAEAQVDAVTSAGTRSATCDEHGRFVLHDLPRGRTCFVVRVGGTGVRPVITPTIEL